MTPVVVLTTVNADFDAGAFARELIEARAAACVNVIPRIRSIYRWQGKVEEENEQLLLIKTTDERVADLKALFARHPYEVPEFVVLPIERIEGPYRNWLIDSVS